MTQSNVVDGTVRHEALSVDNADSTLQIVKERQPILFEPLAQAIMELLAPAMKGRV